MADIFQSVRLGLVPILDKLLVDNIVPPLSGEALVVTIPSRVRAGTIPEANMEESFVIPANMEIFGDVLPAQFSDELTYKSITLKDYGYSYKLTKKRMEEELGMTGVTTLDSATATALFNNHSVIANNWLTDKFRLLKERIISTVAQAAGTYPAGHQASISVSWGTSTTKILKDVLDIRKQFKTLIGINPNSVFMSRDVFDAVLENEDIIDRYKYTQEGVLTEEIIKRAFRVDNLAVGDAVYKDDQKGTLTEMWSNFIVFYYKPASTTIPSPYFLIEVPRDGYPQMEQWEDRNTQYWTRYECYTVEPVTTPAAVYATPI